MIEHKRKTFVVTGANTGIGFETAKALAKLGAKVIVTTRDEEKARETLERLRTAVPDADVHSQLLDLASLASIKAAADALRQEERLDVLINNAGLGTAKGGTTAEGFEIIMGTNHIGTFAFTELLMPKIKFTAKQRGEARVINLSSMAHQFARKLDPQDLLPAKRSMGRDAYSESKLCNLLHVKEMARRYGRHGVRAHAVHPGFVNSDFGRSQHFPGPWQALFLLTRPMQISPAKGARTSVVAALSDEGAWGNGLYWDKEKPVNPTLPPQAEKVAKALWDTTERLLASVGFALEHEDDDEAPAASRTSPGFPDGL